MNRRHFLNASALLSAAAFTGHAHSHHHADEAPFETGESQPPLPEHPLVGGSGEFRYQYAPEKLTLPPGVKMRNGHGLCLDTQGNIYFTFEPEQVEEHTRCLVRYAPDGTQAELLGRDNGLAHGVPHGLNIHVDNDGHAVLYHANNDATVHKTTLDGQILWTQKWTPQMGNYKPTDAVVPPAGDRVVVADGYGSSMLHVLKTGDGVYAGKSWGGLGSAHGELNCPHGITYDPRRKLLLTADRGNKRLEYFTVNGFYHSTIEAKEITAPCNADIRGDHVLVPDLDGPLVILDKDNKVVSVIEVSKLLGDQGFRHPHDAIWLANGDIAVCTWNPGRLGYLEADSVGARDGWRLTRFGNMSWRKTSNRPSPGGYGAAGIQHPTSNIQWLRLGRSSGVRCFFGSRKWGSCLSYFRSRLRQGLNAGFMAWAIGCGMAQAAITAEQAAQLPPPAGHAVNFSKEIKPIFEASCVNCHGRGKEKSGFRLDTRETTLRGGDSGPAVLPGKSAESLLIALVQGFDPDNTMPKKGTRLTPEQIGLLRAWIDQGMPWDANVTFGRVEPANLKPRVPAIPTASKATNPIDRFLAVYFTTHQIKPVEPVNDRLFVRRAYLDVIGLLPPPEELETFEADRHGDKRDRMVERLLADDRDYAEHWLSFWNDLLRNDYKGTGYIDGGRKQITRWLYSALLTNMPYNKFVAELVNPTSDSEGFTKGIVWRGVVNASQTPQMQTAQNIAQVFMGVNLKCASCHDSFINDLTLADAYGLAGIYADGPLEMVRCDKPTGKQAELKFLYPELGAIDPKADKPARLKRLAEIITQRQDARLTRTLVNRFWQRFMGRGLIEPVDDMEKTAWNPDLLDWLAEDFAGHNYDVKHLIGQILTSRAYQLPAVNLGEQQQQDFVFRGPAVRRLSAEEFRDALTRLTGTGYASPAAEITLSESEQRAFAPPMAVKWIWNDPHAADKAKAGHVYFRKAIVLSEVPADAIAAVICDNSFTLFLNGRKVGSGSDFKEAFLFDLRPYLKPGTNLFALDAVNHLPDNSLPGAAEPAPGSENPAGLLFYARLRSSPPGVVAKVAHYDFASDSSWACSEVKQDNWETPGFAPDNWAAAVVLGDMGLPPWRVSESYLAGKLARTYPGNVRAALVAADPLTVALARPNREQVVTTRPTVATTLQALELTNGETLADLLKRGAGNLLAAPPTVNSEVITSLYEKALGRKPTDLELQLARELVGQPVQPSGVEDLLWSVAMLPEFQLIY